MNKLTGYITTLLLFISLNKRIEKTGSDFYGQSRCLAQGLNNIIKDGKVTNEELDDFTAQLADTCASLINLLEEFKIPEEVPED